jgi:uncharacterized protein YkwD
MEQEMFRLHNAERGAGGLAPLRIDAVLTRIARERAQEMAALNYFSHSSPTGATAFNLLSQVGYGYMMAAENIARNNYPAGQTVATAMTGFMNSPSHRVNIMDVRLTHVGVGVVAGADGMYYYAVVFTGQ